MGNIVLLDDLTINKIAAGEVIERPASVVKEMVENSIDAGAKNITVEIRNGGISFIKISDDGKGIAQDDLEIAFERHATSKIRSAEDLNTVKSMGFRGEALASIAAISNVEVVSKPENQEVGYKVVVEAGDILDKQEVGCKNGTTMTVKNLFFNTPVRYKFLKKDFTESGYIEDVITRIALVNPDISIKLINTGKTVIQTTGNGKLKDVVYSIYGKDIAENIIETTYDYEDIKVNGVIGKPSIARSNRNNQIFFVNKRYIKDKTLTAAIEQAFKGIIPIGKFAFAILNLEIDPSKVDVNVHPAKLEVRFEEESKVFQAIYHTVKDALLKVETDKESENVQQTLTTNSVIEEPQITTKPSSFSIFNWKNNDEKSVEESNFNTDNIIEDIYNQKIEGEKPKAFTESKKDEIKNNDIEQEKNNNLAENKEVVEKVNNELDALQELKEIKDKITNDVNKINEESQKYNYEKEENKESLQEEKTKEDNNIEIEQLQDEKEKLEEKPEKVQNTKDEKVENTEQKSQDFDSMFEKTFGKLPIQEKTEKEEIKDDKHNAVDLLKDNLSIFNEEKENKKPIYKYVGIAFEQYAIVEIEKEMYIVDIKSANAKIMYEKIKKNYYRNGIRDSQMLLLPDVITLTHKEMDIINENIDMIEKVGFSLEEFGENTIKLTGVPTACVELNTKEMFLEILGEINTVAITAKQEKEEKFIWTVAYKVASNKKIDKEEKEIENIMDSLLILENPFECPNGKGLAVKMTQYDIERKFSRK